MRKVILINLFIATVIFGCKNKSKNIDFEKSVLIEIIPSIVDSTCHDPRIFLSPPIYFNPPTPDGMIPATNDSSQYKSLLRQWNRRRDSLKNDTSSIYLAINPLIKVSTDSLEEKLAEYTNRKILKINSDEKLTLDINSIELNQHFKFKHDSLFSEKINIWQKKYNFIFSGFFGVSRILFDERKNYGILSAGYTCGDRCGQGYIIYIKKHGNKWMIDKIEDTWIS